MKILIAGCSGYYGKILSQYLMQKDVDVYGIDLVENSLLAKEKQVAFDLTDTSNLVSCFQGIQFDAIINLAAFIDFASKSEQELYENNMKVALNLAKFAQERAIKSYIFTSSNSIFLGNSQAIISQQDKPIPIDAYGRSKVDAERVLWQRRDKFNVLIFRCPNIIDSGRLGMLTILFELLKCNATLWVLDRGVVRHQCIYAQDLNSAIYLALKKGKSNIFNIGADGVESFANIYHKLIKNTKSRSRLRSIPKWLGVGILKFLFFLKLSPMGPYQFRMLTKDFEFETSYIKSQLGWRPSKTTADILDLAYVGFLDLTNKGNASNIGGGANGKPVNMGALNLLKLIKL